MTPEEVTQALTYTNQIDPRVQLNDANEDVWRYSLSGAHVDQVRWVIRDYYGSGVNADGGGQQPITPAYIKRRAAQEAERAASKRTALERGQRETFHIGKHIGNLRESPEFQQAVTQGTIDHLDNLERREIIKPDQQRRLDQYRQTGQLPPKVGGMFSAQTQEEL